MSSAGRAVSPPHLSSSPRSGGGSAARISGEMQRDLDDVRRDSQMEHDLDAARAMSRARANSNVGRSAMPTTSPRSIPYHARRPSDNADMLPGPAMDFDESRGAGSSGNVATMGGASTSPRHAFPIGASPAALRHTHFYHHRQGSNTSLDSANHFIDHRSNQLAASYVPSPSRLHSNYSGASNGGAAFGRSLGQRGALTRSPHALRAGMSPGEDAVAEDEGPHIDDIHRAAARRRASRASGARDEADLAVPGTPHTMSRRPSMLEDDVCFPMTTPGDEMSHDHMEGGMHHTPRNALGGDEHDAMHHHHAGQGERCPPGYPFTFDLSALESFAAEERSRLEAGATATSSSWAATGLRQRSAATMPIEPRGSDAASGAERAAAYAVSPDSDDATFYSRRPRRFTPADGTDVGGGSSRYQRKLALFEGGSSATSPPPIPVGGRPSIMGNGLLVTADAERARAGSAAADAKTPLLAGGSAPSYDAGRYDEASKQHLPQPQGRSDSFVHPRDRRRNTTAFGARSTTEKPYRFTFYSNALPSTIHARHLAELPAPGQTFEELFSGLMPETPSNEQTRAPTPGEAATEDAGSGGSAARPANRQASALAAQLGRMEGSTAPPTGANTPELASAPLGGAAPSVAGQSGFQRASGANAARNSSVPANAGRVIPGGGIRMDQDPEANTWWLDVLSPTDQEMKLLSRVFGIHPLTTEDILMEETREKIELFRNYYLVCFRSFDQDPYSPTYLEPLNMYIIVFREGTLSFHFRATPHPQNVRRRIKQLKDYINVTSDWISYALIDDITDAFGPLIQSIEYEVDSIDELVLILKEAEQSDMLRRIGTCRKKVMGLLRLMGNKADVVKGLAKRCNENWSVAPKSDIGLYLSDIQDHLITMTQNLNHYEKILSRSHSNYLAQISIEMTDANNQINDVLSKLTALGTVIVPMNVITGLWGMNVHVPGQDVEDNLYWFAGIVSFMAVIGVAGYIATIKYLNRT